MAIALKCPECEKNYKLSDRAAGGRFPCSACGERLVVPRRRAARKPVEKSEPHNHGFRYLIAKIGLRNVVSIAAGVALLGVGVFGLVFPAFGIWIGRVGIGTGFLLVFSSVIWIYSLAFLEDTHDFRYGLKCILLPGYVLYYTYSRLDQTWKAVLISVAGGITLFLAVSYMNFAGGRADPSSSAAAKRRPADSSSSVFFGKGPKVNTPPR